MYGFRRLGLLFAWYVFFPFFLLLTYLNLSCVSYTQLIVKSFLSNLINSAIFICMFRPFIYNVIIDMARFTLAILLSFFHYSLHEFYFEGQILFRFIVFVCSQDLSCTHLTFIFSPSYSDLKSIIESYNVFWDFYTIMTDGFIMDLELGTRNSLTQFLVTRSLSSLAYSFL